MSSLNNDIVNKINMLYLKAGYMDKYGSDVWTSVIICAIFSYLICSYASINALDIIRADWDNQKCNPLVMPFAGFINKPPNQTNAEYTTENFAYCVNSTLRYIAFFALQPFLFMITLINQTCKTVMDAVNSMRNLLDKLRENFKNISQLVNNAFGNIMVSFITFMVKFKDSMGKMQGVLTTSLYTLFGSYMAMQSFFLLIIDMIIIILIIICCIIIVYWIIIGFLYGIPFVGPALALKPLIFNIILTLLLIGLLIPVIWIKIMMDRVMALGSPATPGVPSCFAENTPIELADGTEQPIKNIKLGDHLRNGSVVTATIKLSAADQHIYNLNNVLVTGEHRVFDSTLKWLKVKNHPESIHMPEFNEPFVYCLNTTKKEFTIRGTIYSDWDDIDSDVLTDLKQNAVSAGHLPSDFTLTDIHTYLDSGFHPSTPLVLANGSSVPIAHIQVNDVLQSGEKILGVFKVAAHDLDLYKYSGHPTIRATRNIHIDDPVLGMIDGMELTKGMALSKGMAARTKGMDLNHSEERSPQNTYAYHVLTQTGFVTIHNIRFNDYNYAIDKYLRSV